MDQVSLYSLKPKQSTVIQKYPIVETVLDGDEVSNKKNLEIILTSKTFQPNFQWTECTIFSLSVVCVILAQCTGEVSDSQLTCHLHKKIKPLLQHHLHELSTKVFLKYIPRVSRNMGSLHEISVNRSLGWVSFATALELGCHATLLPKEAFQSQDVTQCHSQRKLCGKSHGQL